jgi:uncharacterized OB-fold protein
MLGFAPNFTTEGKMEISRHWRLRRQRYGLVGEVCEHCGDKIFPPRDVCPKCAEEAKTTYVFSGKGEVYSYSTVYDAPEGYEGQAPYTVAIVKLEEGPLVTAQLTDVDNNQVNIGQPVEMVTRKLRADGDKGVLVYGYKFRPAVRA